MNIRSRIESGVVVIHVSGRLTVLESALIDYVNELRNQQYRDFVLNVADVPYVDSSGLGQLIGIWVSIHSDDGELILLRPPDHLLKLFQITKLDRVFQTAGDEVEAVQRIGILRGRGLNATSF